MEVKDKLHKSVKKEYTPLNQFLYVRTIFFI
jgi:hypothetical protein